MYTGTKYWGHHTIMGSIYDNGATTRAIKQPSLFLPLAAGGVREGASASSLYYYTTM
jgi:hypothetical protein